ncbi:MAG: hypothetical protein ACOX0F_01340 [Syntrophomonadaceae bacterium]|jgi:hypothetical protein
MAVNRALELKQQGHRVVLADLDTVEPFYTLRPLKRLLEQKGLEVIGLSSEDTFGLGETGAMLAPQARWALWREGDIILDVGYGVNGARTLNLVEGALESPQLRIIAVINALRPMTNTYDRIMEYIGDLGRVDAIVANSHLGDETSAELVMTANQIVFSAAQQLGLPVDYVAVDEKLRGKIREDCFTVPIKYIQRYMPGAMWK